MPIVTAPQFDIAVAGGGLAGLCIALHAARAGKRVVLLERSLPGAEASGRSGGVVRQQGRATAQLALAREAVAHWASLADALGRDVGFRRSGHLLAAGSESELVALQARETVERAHGIESRMLDAAEVRRLAPGLAPAVAGGKYCEADGYALPAVAIGALVEACREAGVVLRAGSPVTGLTLEGEGEAARIAEVHSASERIGVGSFVNAAGAWAPMIAALADVYLPIHPTRGHLALTAPVADFADCVVASASHDFLAVPRPGGGFLVGSKQPDASRFTYSRRPRPEAFDLLRRGLLRLAPTLAEAPFVEGWAGTRECTPDGRPIVGFLPELSNFFVCAGFSGEGFALAPLVGRLAADWLTGGQRPTLLQGQGVERFRPGETPWDVADGVI